MKIAFVGCGYVFDIYMRARWAYPELDIRGVFDIDTRRSAVVAAHYGFHVYPSLEALLADPAVEIVVNLTSIRSHEGVIRAALEAGKHVYTEKPVTLELAATQALFALAAQNGLVLTGAPDNIFSDAVVTMWKAVRDGAIGKPVLVYAELDDNPAHLMQLEHVQSPTGAPFPYQEELQEGCTVEHVAYHLIWICALFGPALSVTAFSDHLVRHKTDAPLDPADTPDFSVACLSFAGGVAARITCTWVSPRDHSFRIIGEEGQIVADNAFHDQSPVHLERFSRVSLAARKAYSVRSQPLLGRRFNLGGRRLKLLRQWKSHAVEREQGVGRSLKHRFVSWLRIREIYAQDKMLGIGEMARAIAANQPQPLPADFLIHLNELTLMIQRAGRGGAATVPTTSFQPFDPPAVVRDRSRDLHREYRPRLVERWMTGTVAALHRK
jgi:predicted dehydrogenase